MEIDIRSGCEDERVGHRVAAARELREPPIEHRSRLLLGLCGELCDGHGGQTRFRPRRYTAVSPPSTAQTAPVTYAASSEARNAMTAATSSGRPIRPSGTRRFASTTC